MRLTPPLRALAALLALAVTVPALAGKPSGGGTTPPPPLPPVRYKAQLFTTPYLNSIYFNDANDLGQAVGWSAGSGGVDQRAWLYDPLVNASAAIDLTALGAQGLPAGWVIRSAVGVNNRGDVVGYLENPSLPGRRQGYVLDVDYSAGTAGRLYLLPDTAWAYTYARRINDDGDVLGLYQRADNTWGAYVFHTGLYDGTPDAAVTDLGLTVTAAYNELNNLGQVAGVLGGGTPYRWTVGAVERFTSIAGTSNQVFGVNDFGDFCGTGWVATKGTSGVNRPVRVVGTTVQYLTTDTKYTRAADLNGAGDTILWDGTSNGYLYRDDWKATNGTGIIDLATILADKAGASAFIVYRVTERHPTVGYGDLAGTARMPDGTVRGALLTAYTP